MGWTTEIPTQDGHYWALVPYYGKYKWVEMLRFTAEERWVEVMGSGECWSMRDAERDAPDPPIWWNGPLPVPNPPEGLLEQPAPPTLGVTVSDAVVMRDRLR